MNASSTVAEVSAKGYDEILKQYLVKAMESTGNLIDKSVDMVMQQAPILVHEVLNWYFTYNLILFVLGLIVVGVVIYADVKFYKWWSKQNYKDEFAFFPVGVVNMGILAITFITLINLTWLKIWIAPRLWLIEYTASLIKSAH